MKRRIATQVVAYHSIREFSRPVGLWMLTGTYLELDSTVMPQVFSKFESEFGVTIRENGVWSAVEAKNMVENAAGHVFGWVLASGRDQSYALQKPIYKSDDAIVVILCQRKVCDKVQSNEAPSFGKKLKWLRSSIRILPPILIPLACVTSAAVLFDA